MVVAYPPVVSYAAGSSDRSRNQIVKENLRYLNSHQKSQRNKNREEVISRALDAQVATPARQPQVMSSSELAWSEVKAPPIIPSIERKGQHFEFGTQVYKYVYKEPIFNLEIEGAQYGVFGAYIYRADKGDPLELDVLNMYKIDARFASGPVDYSSSPSGQLKDEDNYVFEIRGVAGYDYLAHERLLLTGYGGFGFRYLNNDSSGRRTTTGALGYERASRYLYLPLGVEALCQITPSWKMMTNLEWDIFLDGKQTSYLSDANTSFPNIENDQDRGYGLRGSLRIIKVGNGLDLFLEPFFRYWRIHDSDRTTAVGTGVIVTGLEPDNNTSEYGVKLGLEY